MTGLQRYLPILVWGREYNRQLLASDLLAAVIITIMMIPQALAYALLAGLPVQMGLYAGILPLLVYGIFGSSRTLAVGPVAVVSLMTATAAGQVAQAGSAGYIAAALLLALMSGLFLLLMGILRMGFLANFLSHPVIVGFISASGIIIGVSQLKHILGISAHGDNLLQLLASLARGLGAINLPTLALGVVVIAFLFWLRQGLKPLLLRAGVAEFPATLIARAGPVFVVIATSVAAWALGLERYGVTLVGDIPAGLPGLTLPSLSLPLWRELTVSALFISLIGFVESVAMGHTLAARRGQKIDPDQELVGLGAANIAASFTGAYPVTGGFARSIMNFDAGAQTPAAGMFTAVGVAMAVLFLTPYLAYLPQATLAATIIVAVLSLIDLSILRRTWQYGKSEFAAVATTMLATLALGVETGVACGVLASLSLHLYKTSRPHMAEVGEVPGTEHFRNINRREVRTHENILSLRVDQSLYFANASYIEDHLYELLAGRPAVRDVILMCPAVNEIDFSALETLESINRRLESRGIRFHLSEVKGPVMDALKRTHFLQQLTGQVWLTQHQAVAAIAEAGESAAL